MPCPDDCKTADHTPDAMAAQARSVPTLLKGAGPALWLLPAAQVRHSAPRITRVRPEGLPAAQGQRSALSPSSAGVEVMCGRASDSHSLTRRGQPPPQGGNSRRRLVRGVA